MITCSECGVECTDSTYTAEGKTWCTVAHYGIGTLRLLYGRFVVQQREELWKAINEPPLFDGFLFDDGFPAPELF